LADKDAQEERKRSRIMQETTDRHAYMLFPDKRPSEFTGDPEIDAILVQFMAPPGMGSV